MSDKRTLRLGEDALEKLDALISELNRARRRGRYDIVTNSVIFTWYKRKSIKAGEGLAKDAATSLGSFKKALKDDGLPELDIEEFFDKLKMKDYFLGIFGNITVQEKIVRNIGAAEKARCSVSDRVEALRRDI
ncbi:MAG: hypothetical protein LBU30_04065 [Candidatus Methanoplasma sp.]|jgi:hypothetical protein|nr:hypothetical protein [Candidatus Methanoplasma sp.]